MVEFKQDPTSGQVNLLEVNGRYWGTLALAIAAGVNFPLYQWQLAHGEAPSVETEYRPGIRTRWLSGDVIRLSEVFICPERVAVPTPSRIGECVKFFRDFWPWARIVPWSTSDPVPALVDLIRQVVALTVKAMLSPIKQFRRRLHRLPPV